MKSPRFFIFVGLVVATGLVSLCRGALAWNCADPGKFLSYLLIAVAASGVKIRLPSVKGTVSLSFLFTLISVTEFSRGESILMGCMCSLGQCFFFATTRPSAIQIAFNVATAAASVDIAFAVQHGPLQSGLLTAAALFLASSAPVATVVALTENKNPWNLWRDSWLWTFPNYLVGAAAAWVVGATGHQFGWQAGLFLTPIGYIVYRSHQMYIEKLEEARKRAEQETAHAREVAALHRRTIETLALAIEAKDQTTHDHLERVETYAVAIGKELGLKDTEVEALRAAALLHDIGKLAVPEYIIAKPGKLTPEEFERMKTHTVVGAEIVDRIRFPYAVAPMVRGHHERWDGTGYPDGLAGEQIPIGARILAAVDCLDALASDRQYRRALPLGEAMGIVESLAGKHFDPAVVEILARRHVELDALAKSGARIARLPTGVRVERGEAPAAGFEKVEEAPNASPEHTGDPAQTTATSDVLAIRNAVGTDSGNDCSLRRVTDRIAASETREAVFGVLKNCLRDVIPCDVMVVYRREGDRLSPGCVDGVDSERFESLSMPVGEGLSGWVAEHGRAIVNGNPDVEPGYQSDPRQCSTLRAALAVPLIAPSGIWGVLSLYRRERDAFTNANLAALTSVSTVLAAALESLPAGQANLGNRTTSS